jgi:nucleoid DNA-binding protein
MSTKKEIIDHISSQTGLTQTEVKKVVQSTFDYIFNVLVQGGNIELRNFGVFMVKTQKARVGRNPKKPEVPIHVPAKTIPCFKPGKLLKKKVLELKVN